MLQSLTLWANNLYVQTGTAYPEHNRFNNWMHRALSHTVCDIREVISYIIVKSKCEVIKSVKTAKRI